MVTVGETDAEPLPSATKPTLLSMLNTISLSVLLVVHESVEEPPGTMEAGLAESVQVGSGKGVGSGAGGSILKLSEQTAFPPGPVAVQVQLYAPWYPKVL